jgi:putative transposase
VRTSRFTEAQIVAILREAEKGELSVKELCRVHGVAESAFYRWRKRYGDLEVNEVRRLRELEAENARLKRLLAERDLELDAIREVLRGK